MGRIEQVLPNKFTKICKILCISSHTSLHRENLITIKRHMISRFRIYIQVLFETPCETSTFPCLLISSSSSGSDNATTLRKIIIGKKIRRSEICVLSEKVQRLYSSPGNCYSHIYVNSPTAQTDYRQ